MSRQYPPKTGKCSISECNRTPTDWHHIISQAQIITRGLPESMFTDPGNLQELCRYHHDMTTASLTRKRLTKRNGPYKARPRLTSAQRKKLKEERIAEFERKEEEKFSNIIMPSLEKMHKRGAANPKMGLNEQHSQKLKRFRINYALGRWEGMLIENAYPPDHWLHNPELYDEEFSIEVENGGKNLWTNNGWIRTPRPGTKKFEHDKMPQYMTYYMS